MLMVFAQQAKLAMPCLDVLPWCSLRPAFSTFTTGVTQHMVLLGAGMQIGVSSKQGLFMCALALPGAAHMFT